MRPLAWILAALFALSACGAVDREPEQEAAETAQPAQAALAQPEALPADPPPAAATPTVAEREAAAGVVHPTERLYTVQIAAYLSADSAQALAAKLAARGLPVWTMEVRVGERSYHRIRVGAHPRLGEVRRLGAQISAQYRQEVWVAPVDMSSRIPTNAVEATRALLARP